MKCVTRRSHPYPGWVVQSRGTYYGSFSDGVHGGNRAAKKKAEALATQHGLGQSPFLEHRKVREGKQSNLPVGVAEIYQAGVLTHIRAHVNVKGDRRVVDFPLARYDRASCVRRAVRQRRVWEKELHGVARCSMVGI